MKLEKVVQEHVCDVYSYGGVDMGAIRAAEEQLAVSFPSEMKAYLSTFGALECRHLEFFGLGLSDSSHLNTVTRTDELRAEGLPKQMVAIQDLGDMHYAVCGEDGHVYEWAPEMGDTTFKRLAESLDDYMVAAIREAVA